MRVTCITATATNTSNFPWSLQDKRDHPLTNKAAVEWTVAQKKMFPITQTKGRGEKKKDSFCN